MHSFGSPGHFPSFPRTSSFCSSQVELRKREMHPAPLPGERGPPGAACEAGVGVQEGKGWQERPSRVPAVQGVSWSLAVSPSAWLLQVRSWNRYETETSS